MLGGFTDFMPEKKAAEIMQVIQNPAESLHISTFAQRKDRIANLAGHLDDEKLIELIAAAFADANLLVEVGMITAEMNAEGQKRMAKLTKKVNADFIGMAKAKAEELGYADRLTAYFSA